MCGASNSACIWLRLPKLCLSYVVLFKPASSTASRTNVSSVRRKLVNLACVVAAIAHVSACGWFYIGNKYQVHND